MEIKTVLKELVSNPSYLAKVDEIRCIHALVCFLVFVSILLSLIMGSIPYVLYRGTAIPVDLMESMGRNIYYVFILFGSLSSLALCRKSLQLLRYKVINEAERWLKKTPSDLTPVQSIARCFIDGGVLFYLTYLGLKGTLEHSTFFAPVAYLSEYIAGVSSFLYFVLMVVAICSRAFPEQTLIFFRASDRCFVK